MAYVAGESLCKLMLNRPLNWPHILSRLIVKWFNPACSGNEKLKACIGTFLPMYSEDWFVYLLTNVIFVSCSTKQDTIVHSLMPMLNVLKSAPVDSPLTQIAPKTIASFVAYLTKNGNVLVDNEVSSNFMFISKLLLLEYTLSCNYCRSSDRCNNCST